MFSKRAINLFIILAFLVLVGFSMAMAISRKSAMGIILSIVSLGAAVTFIYYLNKAASLQEAEKQSAAENSDY